MSIRAASEHVSRLTVLLFVTVLPAVAVAQTPTRAPAGHAQARAIRIPRVSRPPSLDALRTGQAPPGFERISGLLQQRPADGTPVSRETTAFIGYDDEHLYVAFICKDEPGHVRARMAKRDDIFSDDLVGLFLDTFNDHQHALSFYVNPLGVQSDSVYTEGQMDDYSFDAVWHRRAR